ncbi:MAG: hypothetical protein ACKOCD_08830 [Nitrospiraceae bacterium]
MGKKSSSTSKPANKALKPRRSSRAPLSDKQPAEGAARDRLALPVSALTPSVDPSRLGYKNTSELSPLEEPIGQDRAVEALEFGLRMPSPGFNVYVPGPIGSGKWSMAKDMVKRLARQAPSAPDHDVPDMDLLMEQPPSKWVTIPVEEEQRLLNDFLESVYLEWADRPSPNLDGQTPRHAAANPAQRERVASLIDQLEREDVALRRTGKPGYAYNRLRAHVGLPEIPA